MRRGLVHNVDVGARVSFLGGAVDAQVRSAERPFGLPVTVSAQPGLGSVFPQRSFVSLPLVVGAALPGDVSLAVAPAAVPETVWLPGGPQSTVLRGGSVDAALPLPGGFSLLPTASVLAPVSSSPLVGTLAGQAVLVQPGAGVGHAFGR